MRIQGLKNAPMGTHNVVRYVTNNGEKTIDATILKLLKKELTCRNCVLE